ncbi:MAG: hypothetical protein CVV33_10360 [Methanomicrobiales archaeon HGW-Methanomicrobiales-4]|nr:MAG: hypothetical protein CVV33_10360 [Methanomicrobiales archaeon HGW-Methanomicrobiales-4]
MSGKDDERNIGGTRANPLEKHDSIHIRHKIIRDDCIIGILFQERLGNVGRFGGINNKIRVNL